MLALFVVLGATIATCGGKGPEAPPNPDACPYRTVEEWQGFLDHWAADTRWAPTCEEGGCDAAFYQEVDEGVRKVFDACADVLATRPGLDACTANLRHFTPSWLQQHSPDSYGFTVDNHTYFAAQEGPGEPPGMMTPAPDLVRAVPDARKIAAVAREHGWKYLEQDSCLGVSRLFVLVSDPAGRFDQWSLFNLDEYTPGPGAAPTVNVTRTVSFLAVQKKDASGVALGRVRLHFRDYRLVGTADGGAADGGADGTYGLTLDENTSTKCFSCHPSGVRQLIGRPTPFLHALPVRGEPEYAASLGGSAPPDVGPQRLAELNARLASYGLPDWNGLVLLPNLGPMLGKDVGCTGCHNGHQRGVLSMMTSQSQLDEKIAYELSMPPDANLQRLVERREMNDPQLTAAEEKTVSDADKKHQALDDQVQASRAGALRDWMLLTRCR